MADRNVPLGISAIAEANGHTGKSEPAWWATAVERWTCTRCGAEVHRYGGNVYGNATSDRCTSAAEAAAEVPSG